MKNLITVLFLSLLVSASAQKRELDLGDFNEIYFGISGTVYVTQGNENSVVIEADDETWEYLEVDVESDKLKIRNKNYKSWRGWNKKVTAYVTMKDIRGFSVGGSGDIIGKNRLKTGDLDISVSGSGSVEVQLDSEDLDISISGSGNIELEGQADDVDLSISGSGRLKAEDLEVNVIEASISGSGTCYITANEEIDARISGSGTVFYKGDPDRVSSRSSGSGSVKKM